MRVRKLRPRQALLIPILGRNELSKVVEKRCARGTSHADVTCALANGRLDAVFRKGEEEWLCVFANRTQCAARKGSLKDNGWVASCQFAGFPFLASKSIVIYSLRVTPLDGIFCKESFFLALYFQYFTEEWGGGG